MKKFMMCLLSLGIILSGCVQEEQPEEPPVVDEENEKLPDDNLDENINDSQEDESIDDKTGSDKDNGQSLVKKYPFWNWINEINQMSFSNYATSSGKINEDDEYLVIVDQKEIDSPEMDEFTVINNSDSELYNWLTTMDFTNEVDEYLYLNLHGEFSKKLNSSFKEYFEATGKAMMTSTLSGRYEIHNDVLSIILRMRSYRQDMVIQSFQVYNIDLTTNRPMKNEQLLNQFGYTIETAQKEINNQLLNSNLDYCRYEEEIISENCYFKDTIKNGSAFYHDNLSSNLSEDSILFINEYGKLNMIVYVHNPEIRFYNGEKSNYFIIDFS